MMRPNLRLLALSSVFPLLSGLAWAAPPTSPPPGSSSESPSVPTPRVEEFQSLGIDRRLLRFGRASGQCHCCRCRGDKEQCRPPAERSSEQGRRGHGGQPAMREL